MKEFLINLRKLVTFIFLVALIVVISIFLWITMLIIALVLLEKDYLFIADKVSVELYINVEKNIWEKY